MSAGQAEGSASPAGLAPENAGSATPLYRRVVERLAAELADRTLAAGSQLPPERTLRERYGVSRVTVRRALQELAERGLLEASPGRGWFVVPADRVLSEPPNALQSFSESGRALGLVSSAVVLANAVEPASVDDAELFRVAPGAPLLSLERLRLLDGIPIAVHRSRVPLALAPALRDADFREASLYAILDEAGAAPVRGDCVVQALRGDERVRGLLEVDADTPIMSMRQITYDMRMRVVEDAAVCYRADRYRLRTSLQRRPPVR